MSSASSVLEHPQPAAPRTQSQPEVVASIAPELPASTSPLRAFKNRDFLLLLTGAFVSNIGTWMERVAVGVWVTETTGKAAATGFVTAMLFLPVAILAPIGGALTDRSERRSWLLRCSIAQAAVAALLALLASLHWLTVPLMGLLMFLTGCTSVLLTAGFNALIADLMDRKDLTSAMFLNSGQWNMARIVGPLLAAPVVAFGSASLALWINALSFAGVIYAVVKMRFPPQKPHSAGETLKQSLMTGIRTARNDAGIFSALAITGLAGLFIAPFIGLIPVFALQVLNEGPAAASLLVAAQGTCAVVAALVSASLLDRVGAAAWLRGTCIAAVGITAAFWLAPTLGWALAAMVVLGAVYLSLVTSTSRVALGKAPPGTQARVASLFHMMLDTTYALGVIAAGAAADLVGLREVGVATAVIFGVLMLALARSRRHLFTSLH
jgi:MFS family permease